MPPTTKPAAVRAAPVNAAPAITPAAIPPTVKAAAAEAPVAISAVAKSQTDPDRGAVIVRIPAIVVRVVTVVVWVGRGRVGNRIDGGGRSVSGVRLNVSRRWLDISRGILCWRLRGRSRIGVRIDWRLRRSRHVLALVEHGADHVVRHPLVPQIDDVLRSEIVDRARVADEVQGDVFTDLGPAELEDVVNAIRQFGRCGIGWGRGCGGRCGRRRTLRGGAQRHEGVRAEACEQAYARSPRFHKTIIFSFYIKFAGKGRAVKPSTALPRSEPYSLLRIPLVLGRSNHAWYSSPAEPPAHHSSVKATATVASTALPPCWSTRRPASVAVG